MRDERGLRDGHGSRGSRDVRDDVGGRDEHRVREGEFPKAGPPRGAEPGADFLPAPGTSPTLQALAARVSAAGEAELPALLDAFWRDVDRRGGTPLVEEIDGEPGFRAVTFLWRGDRATRQVLLLANRLADRDRLADALLARLPGTDVWHRTYRLRADHRGSYRIAADLSPGDVPSSPEAQQLRLRALSSYAAQDPLNSHRIEARWGLPDGSLFALPDAPAQPWADRRAGIPRGRLERHRLPAGALGAERGLWAYLPPEGPRPDSPVVVLCDGDMWFGPLALQDTLDALVADGAVPPPVVLAPDAVDLRTRWQDLTARDAFLAFLADEVLPWAAGHWPLTADPARTVVAGQSLGGLTALYAALRRPERFGAVLAQSASLWWRPGLPPGVPDLASDDGTPWLVERFAEAARHPRLRVHLDVGLHEGVMVDHSRLMYETLAAQDHTVTLAEFNGGHDYACWRGGLADGLVSLLTP
ncbi:enterochelin esterase [Streptomyces silaceus]|uniref:enterochelin esterase n=1 Tax=Streptomyces silaceus TaxID=545123 RepID=UPI001FC99B38|nr:enterochelin esterase [Streptomyces silaceus]